MRVLDIVVADQDAPIVAVAKALIRWHTAACADPIIPGFSERLQESLTQLRDSLTPFEAIGVSVNTPKIHRARDVATVVTNFGGARLASTDTYEMAHKALKKVFQRYVRSSSYVVALGWT